MLNAIYLYFCGAKLYHQNLEMWMKQPGARKSAEENDELIKSFDMDHSVK